MKKSILTIIVLSLLLAAFLTLPATAEEEDRVIFDNGNFLYSEDESELAALAQEKAEETGCSFYIVTYKARFSGDEYLGEKFLEDQKLSEDSDMIVLIITREDVTYYYDIYLYGDAGDKVPQRERDYLLDLEDVYDNLKSGHLKEGVIAFLNEGAELYEGMSAGYEKVLRAFYLKIFLISFVIAAIFALIACFSVYKSYTAKKKSVDYPLDRFAKMELKGKEDVFTGSFITRRIIQTGSGHGGRSGGGGRGGGRGHGGGR